MAQYRMLVTLENPSVPVRDHISNTFYLDTDLDPLQDGEEGRDNLAQDTASLFAGYRTYPEGFTLVRARLYNMSDPLPREPLANKTAVPVASAAAGTREVAVCLSYFADRNLPRKRGRMYLGPWGKTALDLRPAETIRTQIVALAEGISGLGGANVQWVQYSPTTGDFSNVTDYWIDDEWDTVRSRGLLAQTRTTGTVDG